LWCHHDKVSANPVDMALYSCPELGKGTEQLYPCIEEWIVTAFGEMALSSLGSS
jgi:hypothetical protein